MDFALYVWRQRNAEAAGRMVRYEVKNISPDMSFLEMLDVVNEELTDNGQGQGQDPIAFDHDCREGICGSCGMMINGVAHGPHQLTTVCQLHMRSFQDGATIYVEPWRAQAFPVIKDLVVDRSAFDRIIEAGGYISVSTGSAPDGNAIPIAKAHADAAMEAASCIGCGACVAACPNASAMLFTAAKMRHLNILPQGKPEQATRVRRMIAAMDREIFGSCTNHGECQEACPKGISLDFISEMNRDLLAAYWNRREGNNEST